MALKDAWNALIGKNTSTDIESHEDTSVVAVASDAFPVIAVSENQLVNYKKIPLASLGALGTAFAQLPEGARTVVQTVTKTIATDATLFVGINQKGIPGFLRENQYGTVGNIMQVNAQGKQVIAGRMRFKALDGLPVKETTTTVMPIDPTLMVVAVALVSIEKKLDGIQKSVEEVLQFLKQEKQSRQRGNLNMLTDIMEAYKLRCQDEKFCMARVNTVMSIKQAAYQDIDFYQNQITAELQKQKSIHGAKDSKALLEAVSYQFAEYQLACHLYAFSTFLDVMLQRNFGTEIIENVTEEMGKISKRYEALYIDCHEKISKYQSSSVGAKVVGGLGATTKGLGKVIAAVPVIRDGSVDEALISAGESIDQRKRDALDQKMQMFEMFEKDRMKPFVENLKSVEVMYNGENAMITDGENLYILQSA